MTFESDAVEPHRVAVPTLGGSAGAAASPFESRLARSSGETRTEKAHAAEAHLPVAHIAEVQGHESRDNDSGDPDRHDSDCHDGGRYDTGPHETARAEIGPRNHKAQQENNRAVLAQVLYSALRHGASAPELRESFRGALFDAVRRIRNEDGLTVNQAARDYGVRRNDLASTDVDDHLDVAVLRVAMSVVALVQRQGEKTPNGFEMTHERIRAALDAEKEGLWTTLSRTYPRDAFRYVIERVLKSSGASEPATGRIAVQAKSFFPAVKLSEAIPFAHFSVGEYVDVVSAVVEEMKTVAYRAGLRLRQSPRTRDAAYASLSIKWNGDACSLVDCLRDLAQGGSDEGESLTVVVGARKS